jgi:hypothetical protein
VRTRTLLAPSAVLVKDRKVGLGVHSRRYIRDYVGSNNAFAPAVAAGAFCDRAQKKQEGRRLTPGCPYFPTIRSVFRADSLSWAILSTCPARCRQWLDNPSQIYNKGTTVTDMNIKVVRTPEGVVARQFWPSGERAFRLQFDGSWWLSPDHKDRWFTTNVWDVPQAVHVAIETFRGF